MMCIRRLVNKPNILNLTKTRSQSLLYLNPLYSPKRLYSEEKLDSIVFQGEHEQLEYTRVSQEGFSSEILSILNAPINVEDIEVTPDGHLYLPEIKYRRILNQSFGPGGWALVSLFNVSFNVIKVPRGPHTTINKTLSREYALFAHGRFISQARGEQVYFSEEGIPTATEGCKSNALMRCCKDLGIAYELWDPRFIRKFKNENIVMVQGVHVRTGQSKWLYKRKNDTLEYPFKEKEAPKTFKK
ncbi:hypothetical protein HDV06_003089 [Boothiomyces sp. JEL0866]|nr:hypothetical protein HDV06_003089 [Boothiomyces sp. JEL0866]